MSKIVNITSKEDKDQKLQDIANSLQELKDVMAEVIEAYEEDNADSRKMDTLTEALDALEDAYEAVSDVPELLRRNTPGNGMLFQNSCDLSQPFSISAVLFLLLFFSAHKLLHLLLSL